MSNSVLFFGANDVLPFAEFPKFISRSLHDQSISPNLIFLEFPKTISKKMQDHFFISFNVTEYPMMPAMNSYPKI